MVSHEKEKSVLRTAASFFDRKMGNASGENLPSILQCFGLALTALADVAERSFSGGEFEERVDKVMRTMCSAVLVSNIADEEEAKKIIDSLFSKLIEGEKGGER